MTTDKQVFDSLPEEFKAKIKDAHRVSAELIERYNNIPLALTAGTMSAIEMATKGIPPVEVFLVLVACTVIYSGECQISAHELGHLIVKVAGIMKECRLGGLE